MVNPSVVVVAGVRPQYVKTKAVLWLLEAYEPETFEQTETFDLGQHYSPELSDSILSDLELEFSHRLHHAVGDRLRGVILGTAIAELSRYFDGLSTRPVVVVFGDASSVVAGAFAAHNASLPLVHIEAGARRDQNEIEHHNSVIVDRLADVRLAYTERAFNELRLEGLEENSHVVGDVALDWYMARYGDLITEASTVGPRSPILVSLHRPSNMTSDTIMTVAEALMATGRPVRWLSYPRTEPFLQEVASLGVEVVQPLSHSQTMAELSKAAFVLTDSGGLSREAHYFKCPVLMRRDKGGWPELMEAGFVYSLSGRSRVDVDSAISWAESVRTPELSESPLVVAGGGRSIARLIASTARTARS